MNSGIYAIRNVINGKNYVGSTINFEKRWGEHVRTLNNDTHTNVHLQRAWKKYGNSSFEFKILECIENPTLKTLLSREEWWTDTLNSYIRAFGYNTSKTPYGGKLGTKASEETLKKMSKSMSGKNHPMWGKHLKEDTKAKLRDLQLGVPKPRSGPRTKARFISPTGKIFEVVGIRGFCRDHPEFQLSHQSMSSLAKGKMSDYKGWKLA